MRSSDGWREQEFGCLRGRSNLCDSESMALGEFDAWRVRVVRVLSCHISVGIHVVCALYSEGLCFCRKRKSASVQYESQ